MTINEFLETHNFKIPEPAGRILSLTEAEGKIVVVTDHAIFLIRDAWGDLGFTCSMMCSI
jgi:hypothetical protein